MNLSDEWKDYECISAGNGEKLERWGNVILRRPDPQAILMLIITVLIKVVDTGIFIKTFLSIGL